MAVTMQGDNIPRFGEATLTDCDREPIHIPGSIQPRGCLLALDPEEMRVTQYAGDVCGVLGIANDNPLGMLLVDLIGERAGGRIRSAAGAARVRPAPLKSYEVEIKAPAGLIDGVVHFSGPVLVVEFEPALRSSGTGMHGTLFTVQHMLAEAAATRTMAEYLQTCVRQIRTLTAFDRVMIYRFLEDGSGKVVAEDRHVDMESFLDLHYPESDIPKQARELYRVNWLRIIPDVGYTPAPVTPAVNPLTGRDLDLRHASFRSVSPLHIQYLKNMGVGASMSISIVHRDRLWGLIACHHRTAHALACDTRAACEMFGQVFSLQLESRLHAENYEYRLQQRSIHQQLVARLAREENLSDGLIRSRPNLLDLIQADGVAVWVDGDFAEIGLTPGQARVANLVHNLNERENPGVFATDRLAEEFPDAFAAGNSIAGMLALSVSRSPNDYIFWFRREITETVTWGGNPNKPVVTEGEGGRLMPRASFAAWRETVRGRSRPWLDLELAAANALRTAILEIVLRRIDQLAREREAARQHQALLVAELDHRVKNTLATIQAVMRHSRSSSDTLDEYVENLERRIRAMAYAQSLLSESRWHGAELRPLVEQELTHFSTSQAAIDIRGPRIELKPKAALSISMVIHELATNAAKYGALSSFAGRLMVAWNKDADYLRIRWRESGGPRVVRPTRRGFGRMMIETSLEYELAGRVDLRFEPNGVECDIAVPLSQVIETEDGEGEKPEGKAVPVRDPLRVLIVEDSVVTAYDFASRLTEWGFTVTGMTGRVSEALTVAEQEFLDLAILDINLGDHDSFPVADRLREKGVPFFFVTGYSAEAALPRRFTDVLCLSKPVSDSTLADAVARATG